MKKKTFYIHATAWRDGEFMGNTFSENETVLLGVKVVNEDQVLALLHDSVLLIDYYLTPKQFKQARRTKQLIAVNRSPFAVHAKYWKRSPQRAVFYPTFVPAKWDLWEDLGDTLSPLGDFAGLLGAVLTELDNKGTTTVGSRDVLISKQTRDVLGDLISSSHHRIAPLHGQTAHDPA